MPKHNDNRMGWFRNLEALASGSQLYAVEYELGSECQIPGLLDYADGKIICASMSTQESSHGLWLYNLILHYRSAPTITTSMQIRKATELPISPGMMRIFDTLNTKPQSAFLPNLLATAAGERSVDRTVFIPTEFHGNAPV